ncbi:hypothetical protein Q5P01_018339 [Channa striata]|uniref:AXH domain-containing protein n=1 Tax=Channa striata TaxID=64152 RepID=A0AA88SDZ1_CHASR|nr:hypothetical protein Q5P01_018339 [Channa striata]
MKSNQERSNECLPPKKREILSSTLPSENRSPTMPPASDSQRTENMAWLASVAGGNESSVGGHHSATQSDGPQYKSHFSTSDSSSSSSSPRLVSSLPAVYTSSLSQSTVGGTVHYTQLPPNLQFIASPYPAPYAGYISPQLLPPPPPPPPLSSSSPLASHRPSQIETASAPSQASKYDQQRTSSGRTSMPPPATDMTPHHVQMSASSRTVPSPHLQGGVHLPPPSLHPHHTLGHGMGHVMVQYTDGLTRKEEGGSRPRELHNGELERGRRFGASPDSSLSKSGSKSRDSTSSLSSYEARQLILPSDYSTHDPSGLRTSVMLMPNSHGDHQLVPPRGSPEKLTTSAPAHLEKGGIILGKPVNRTPSSSNSTSTFTFPTPLSVDSLKAVSTLSPQTVIQTTHNATESLSMGLPSTSIYPQPPIIGYIAGGSGSQHTQISYHTSQQHLLIPGAQPVIIPVSGGGVTTLEPVTSHITSSTQATPFPTTLPHTYIAATAPKGEAPETHAGSYQQATSGAVVQAQLHLPIVPVPPGLVAAAHPPPSSTVVPPSLPPYFIKGSIIQLADGELKRVEDLKTEDFIQSAEISSELKIDSSTVERIEGSHTSPNFAVVQFSVGEHRAQVSVEVLLEYPFFVFGQGWSSCCPDRTTQLLELPCTKLSVGDVCISLTLKNLRNGSLKKTQPLELATPASVTASSHGHIKTPRAVSDTHQSCSGGVSRHGDEHFSRGQAVWCVTSDPTHCHGGGGAYLSAAAESIPSPVLNTQP